jgi:hypothetical protein
VRTKIKVEGCIVEAFAAKETMNFWRTYFSHTNNVNAHMKRYHILEDVPLSELKIFRWKGKGVGVSTSHFVTIEEWNYTIIYIYMSMHYQKIGHTWHPHQQWFIQTIAGSTICSSL